MNKLTLGKVNINDVWLLFFFFIQMIYLILCIFLPLPDGDEKSVIDVVMRTSTAVLAGYFLSKNFSPVKTVKVADENKKSGQLVQSSVVGILGLLSLSLTLIVRFVATTALPYTIIAQLRDFYLASVAFLMGTAE